MWIIKWYISIMNATDSQTLGSLGTHRMVEINLTPEVPTNLNNVEDLSSICRTCATATAFLIPIFEGEGLQNNLADKIHKHLPIKVSPTEALPLAVCYQCVHTLLAWHELAAACLVAERALRTRLKDLQTQDEGSKQVLAAPKDEVQSVQADQTKTEENPPQEWNSCGYESGGDWQTAAASEDDDETLARLASKKTDHKLFRNLFTALTNFKEHFAKHHASENTYPDLTDTESEPDERGRGADRCDDLSHTNMRRDNMDDATREELARVRTRVNGKTYYTCGDCGKNLCSGDTYVFHRRIHTGERPCVCHVCGKQFRTPSGLARHLTETHERLRRRQCRACLKTFANAQNLKQHMRTHTGERPFVCAHCGKRFTQSGSLHAHLKTHEDRLPFQCGECGARFRLRAGLARHALRHTGERPHVCTLCGKAFRQRHELTAHAHVHSGARPHVCRSCPAAFRQRRALRLHVRRLHPHDAQFPAYPTSVPPPPPYPAADPCPYCRAPLPASGHQEHLITAHADLLFHCDECDTYVDRKDFILHMSLHAVQYASDADSIAEKTERIKTPDENQNTGGNIKAVATRYKQSSSDAGVKPAAAAAARDNEFSDHSDTEFDFGPLPESVFEAIEDSQDSQPEMVAPAEAAPTPKPAPAEAESKQKKIRTCPICAKVYTVSSSYFYHMKYFHRRAREHECGVCARRFGTRGALTQHATLHADLRAEHCRHCGKKFRSKASLYIHEQTHGAVKSYACQQCQLTFRWRTHLQRHVKRHLAEKVHVCSTCGRGFSVRCDMLRHARTHAAGSYACEKCGVNFAQLRYLKVHTAKKHSAPPSAAAHITPV